MSELRLEIKDISGFKMVQKANDGYMYQSKSMGLVVIQSISIELDCKVWIHTSYSRRSRIPSYNDTTFIKRQFIGNDKKAIAVYPSSDEHVNIHNYCLHLWHCLDDDGLPDFTQGMGTI